MGGWLGCTLPEYRNENMRSCSPGHSASLPLRTAESVTLGGPVKGSCLRSRNLGAPLAQWAPVSKWADRVLFAPSAHNCTLCSSPRGVLYRRPATQGTGKVPTTVARKRAQQQQQQQQRDRHYYTLFTLSIHLTCQRPQQRPPPPPLLE